MKYDDASWHYGGDFPEDLPEEAGATHIGIFLAWMILNGLASDELLEEVEESVTALRDRKTTGAAILMNDLDEKLSDADFNDEGNAFAIAYYQGENDDSKYVDDYLEAVGVDMESLYSVPDTWKSYDAVAELADKRFAAWKKAGRPKYIK